MTRDLRAGVRNVGWTVGAYGVVHLVGAMLARNATGAAAVEAVVAEFSAGRLHVAWSDPNAPVPDGAAIAKRAGRGALFGAGAATAMIAVASLTGGLRFGHVSGSASSLVLGLIVVALNAVRDELILRGMVVRAFSDLVSPMWLVVIAGLAAAASYGIEGSPLGMVGAGLAGASFAGLWLHDRGAWLAWGAHFAYAAVLGPVTHGGIFDGRPQPGLFGGGDAGPEGGLAGILVLVAAAVAATVWARRTSPAST